MAQYPMIPVPQALETVLTETAISIWFDTQSNNNEDTKTSSSVSNAQQLLGRIAALDIKAPSPGYPNHNASIMDGYAIKTSDLISAKEVYDRILEQEQKDGYILDFDVVGKVYAGDDSDIVQHTTTIKNQRTAIYVTTGAVVPNGYDAVIPVEDTTAIDDDKDNIKIISSKVQSVLSTKPLTWIRPVGCDIPSDYVVLSKGEMIQPVHIALLAQVGIPLNQVSIKRIPRVGILSTGNELVSVSDDKHQVRQQHGKIPDVNRPMLLSQLSTYGNCSPVDLGIVTDDAGYDNIVQRLTKILWPEETEEGLDVLITTGGISMGEKDIMEQVFVKGMGGKVHFGRMNMKPGKPTTFITIDREDTKTGILQRKLIFALPGNPVSASVCSELLVRPCLDLLHDGVDIEEDTSKDTFVEHAVNNARVHEEIMATITSDIKLDQGRPEYRRVTLQRVPSSSSNSGHQQYTYHATHTGVQRSSRVLSLRGADGLMMLPRGGTAGCGYDIAKKGLEFPVLLYSTLSTSASNHTRFMNSMHRGMLKQKTKTKKFALGLIICTNEKSTDHFQTIETTLIKSLGGDNHVSLVHKVVCKVDDTMSQKLPEIINGSQMKDTNVIFVIVPTDSTKEGNGSGGSIAFKASLEVSHLLRRILTKKASALAQQIRMHAASRDPVAALFENVVGTVRDNFAVVISCSDRGLSGAASGVKNNLYKLVDILRT